jgi:hypothetical protein
MKNIDFCECFCMCGYGLCVCGIPIVSLLLNFLSLFRVKVYAVAQWLRYCVTNRKVAGSIPDGVIGIFH